MSVQKRKIFEELDGILKEVHDLNMASAVLYWDQATHMPICGAHQRGRQLATLGAVAHEKFVGERVKFCLDELAGYEDLFEKDSYEERLLNLARKKFQKQRSLPGTFVAKVLEHQSRCYEAWLQAKDGNNFALVSPLLKKTLEYSRQYAQYFEHDHIVDPLIEELDDGFNFQIVNHIFLELRPKLVSMVETVLARGENAPSFLNSNFPLEKQLELNKQILNYFGYSFERGRIDSAPHPFMIHFSCDDVRITTRYKLNDVTETIFSTIHEMGHAFYELGVDKRLDGTMLASGASSGVHESQSRLWENIIGRGDDFWKVFYPRLQTFFPETFSSVNAQQFLEAINHVSCSLKRTDADELTYNLHVMIRFELECALLEGSLSIDDLPSAWNELYRRDLGIVPSHDGEGCLQDMHWYASYIGGQFQCYTLGNIMSAQFYEAACASDPLVRASLKKAQYGPLREWLTQNLHRHGQKWNGLEVLKKATGQELTLEPYLNYLKNKFSV